MFILEGAERFGEPKKDPNRFGFVFVPKGDGVWLKEKLNSRKQQEESQYPIYHKHTTFLLQERHGKKAWKRI